MDIPALSIRLRRGFSGLVLAAVFLAPDLAMAAWHIDVQSDESLGVVVDGTQRGTTLPGRHLLVDLTVGGLHQVILLDSAGRPRWEGTVDVPDGADITVTWRKGQIKIGETGPATPDPNRKTSSSNTSGISSGSGTTTADVLYTTSQVAEVASLVVPGAGLVASAASLASAGIGVASAVGGLPAPSYSSPRPDPAASDLARNGDPDWRASAPRNVATPVLDSTRNMVQVTFAVPAGTQALVNIDGSVMARLTDGAAEQTVLLTPGMHTVTIYDSQGQTILHRGRITATLGDVARVSFSATSKPTCASGCWN